MFISRTARANPVFKLTYRTEGSARQRFRTELNECVYQSSLDVSKCRGLDVLIYHVNIRMS